MTYTSPVLFVSPTRPHQRAHHKRSHLVLCFTSDFWSGYVQFVWSGFVVIMLVLIYCFMCLPFIVCVGLCFWYALFCVLCGFSIILTRERKLVAFQDYVLLLLLFRISSFLRPKLVCGIWLWCFLVILTYFSFNLVHLILNMPYRSRS